MAEAGGCGGLLGMREDEAAESLAGEVGMNEDGADLGKVGGGFEEVRLAFGGAI